MPWTSLRSSQFDPDSMQSIELVDEVGHPIQDDSDDEFEIID